MQDSDNTQNTGNHPSSAGDKSLLSQVRQNVMKQVAELKHKIAIIQQQSLTAMHDSVDAIFKTQASNSLQQLAKQDQDTLYHMETAMQNYPEAAPTGNVQPFDAGRQAVASATKSVEQAMQSAMKSIEDAENTITNLGKQQ